MKIPARALAQKHADDFLPGELINFRDCWALRVVRGDNFHAFLILEGERTGQVLEISSGMAEVVGIVRPYGWYPAVPKNVKPTLGGTRTAILNLTASGPVIVGADARDHWYPDLFAFDLSGQGIEVPELRRALQLPQWSVEMCHVDRPHESLITLLEIDRREA